LRLLVTGRVGYVGSVVAAQLADGSHDVVVLDDLSTGHEDAVPAPATLRRGTVRRDVAAVLATGIRALGTGGWRSGSRQGPLCSKEMLPSPRRRARLLAEE
jgi:NAD dependent epimerase/dehydratase family